VFFPANTKAVLIYGENKVEPIYYEHDDKGLTCTFMLGHISISYN